MTGERPSGIRAGTALIVDIAGTVGLRTRMGDLEGGLHIRKLLDSIIACSRENGGHFIKSYGDDVLAIFEGDPVNAAARTAIRAQRLADQAGLQLYAGFHSGEIEFRETMGHPDALGLTVNIAARLHKLTEGAPGRIFLTEDAVSALAPDLRALAAPFGIRELKGIGSVSIWTLDWREKASADGTVFTLKSVTPVTLSTLVLRNGDREVTLGTDRSSGYIGRGENCALTLVDPQLRVSSNHLQLERSGGRWFVQDISRNGTWLRDGKSGDESQLPHGTKTMLPRSGTLSLGREFADDPAGRNAVRFEVCRD